MSKSNKKMKIIKLILLIIFVMLLTFLTIKLFPLFKNLGTDTGRTAFKNKIDSMGTLGPLAIIGLLFIQLLLAFLPGEPLEILSGMCYGTFWGMVLVLIGTFLGSFIIFFSVKKLGKNFITTFFGEEGYKKVINNKLFKNTKKLEVILFILYFIPGTPKDLFTYIGGLTPIKPLYFLVISTFARIPSVITSTFAGSNITNGNIHLTILSFVITAIISCIGILIFNKIEKQENI